MIEMDVFKQDLIAVRKMLAEAGESLQIDHLREQLVEYNEDMGSPGFWDDSDRAQKVSAKASSVESRIKHYESLISRADDIEVLMELAEEADDAGMVDEIRSEFDKLKEDLEALRLQTLLTGDYDGCNCILSLHAGAGGTEAQDCTQMLYRMYTRFAERMGFSVKLLDLLEGDEAGIKSVTFEVTGDYAYGYLKSERGVHRLVRISPFNANGKRQTSFAACEVMPDIEEDLDIEIDPKDIRIDTYRSSGAGGQHINKTSSAIRITHFPTGIVVTCQNERSQFQNKDKAFQELKIKLFMLKKQQNAEKLDDIRGKVTEIAWGNQIRSYFLQPYQLIKDLRTGEEQTNAQKVLDGDIDPFINAYLRWTALGNTDQTDKPENR